MIIEIEDLAKDYGDVPALKGINLGIEAGGVVGLLGPNGAGKTTLVETLEGLRRPSSGRVSVFDLDPTRQARPLRERIGVQLQSTALPEELTPLETLQLFGAFFRKSLRPIEVLERVGLAEVKVRNHALSGGQRQRLAVSMALINDPELVILDEPTGGLDPEGRREIHGHIGDLRTAKRTVLLCTHSIEEAEKLCDRVIILRAGEVVADGKPVELIARAPAAVTLSIVVGGEFDPAPLLQVGAVIQGQGSGYRRFIAPQPGAAVVALGQLLRRPGVTLVDLQMKRPSLEDVYLDLMGESTLPQREDP
jgi:ABC-2 type transport system ATP-binding protein